MVLARSRTPLLGVDVYWQTFVIGGTLLTAVLIDQLGKKSGLSKALKAAKTAAVGEGDRKSA